MHIIDYAEFSEAFNSGTACVVKYIYTDVAELVLNKCTSTNADKNIRPDSEKFAVTFNYEFLEDRERAALLVMNWLASFMCI